MGALAVRHDSSSAAVVRHSIADDLAGNAVARESIDDVVLVASELVGNAVIHTDADDTGPVAVSWELEPSAVVVRVVDPSDQPPIQRPVQPAGTGGRGLAIVAALASDWGVHKIGTGGKQVWARVPVQRQYS